MFSPEFCKAHGVFLESEDENKIVLLCRREDNYLKDNIEKSLGKKVELKKVSEKVLQKNLLEGFENKFESSGAAVIALDDILDRAIDLGASDIHLEPMEKNVAIRMRTDGVLTHFKTIDKNLYQRLMTRLKIISKLDISQKRLPQDGRFTKNHAEKSVDIRVATAPTSHGEKAVLRILDVERVRYTFEGIGIEGKNLERIKNLIIQPAGLILFCGPTSSGKTSTLYTILKSLNSESINIMTIEDPIEYKIDGINQIEVNENTGLHFETGLKSILRMDPDKIMIGEIRDKETAKIAITSSITGHLVLSTLHTQSSPQAVNRLIDMGVETYLVAAGLIGAISQRLIRILCPHCKKKTYEKIPGFKEPKEIYLPCGCEKCKNGYLGRKAVFEIMTVDDDIKEEINRRASISKLREIAIEKGMNTLEKEVIELILRGETSLEEYYRNVMTI